MAFHSEQYYQIKILWANCTFVCANRAFMVKISYSLYVCICKPRFHDQNCHFAWANLACIHKRVFMGNLCICICEHTIHGQTKRLHLQHAHDQKTRSRTGKFFDLFARQIASSLITS